MKKGFLMKCLVAAMVMFALYQVPSKTSAQVSFQVFYDDLGPYGQWVDDPYYGYVWHPTVEADFRPYCNNGYWAMTEYGNTWVSEYPWGWAPFHYGRWVYDDFYGWEWIPGNVWGPAWVCWRTGGDYYGWAPLGPGVYVDITLYSAPDPWWVFCPHEHFCEPGFHGYYYGERAVPYIHNTVIINNTYVNNNVTYYTGPRVDQVRRETGRNVPVLAVNRSGQRGADRVSGNSVTVYGPRVVRATNTSAAPAPAKVVASTHPINNSTFIKQNRSNVKLPPPRPSAANARTAAPQNNNARTASPQNNNATRPNNANRTMNFPKPSGTNSPRQQAAPRQQPQGNNPAQQNRPAPRQAQPQQRQQPPANHPQRNNNAAPQARPQQSQPRQQPPANNRMNNPQPQRQAPQQRQAPPPQPRENMNRPAPPVQRNNQAPRPQMQQRPQAPPPQPRQEGRGGEERPKGIR